MESVPHIGSAVPTQFPIGKQLSRVKCWSSLEVPLHVPESDVTPGDWTDRLYAAWAILLKIYTNASAVSFIVQTGRGGLGRDESNDPGNCCIASYLLPHDALLEHLRPSLTEVTVGDFAMLNINTGMVAVDGEGSTYLLIEVRRRGPALHCGLHYNNTTVIQAYASSISESFRMILDAFEDKSRRIGDLHLVSDSEKKKLISWNPKYLYRQEACVHHLVQAICRVIPENPAVDSWDGKLTYAQLDLLSTLAADQLISGGVRPGDFVPFAYDKSKWTVVVTLAILKAGAAFVPIDPYAPIARLVDIIKRLEARTVVTTEIYRALFQPLVKTVVIISGDTVHEPVENNSDATIRRPRSGPDDPVFVLFTSGSTGAPKGMIHRHGAIATHAITHGKMMGYHGARVLQFAAHTFDVAIIDMYTTLIYGGCVCIPSEEERRTSVIPFINEKKVDFAIFTPVMCNVMNPDDMPTLRTLAVGGEALAQECLDRWIERVNFIQIYGPAEVGICLAVQMRKGVTHSDLVGYPLENCSCWLVDPENPETLVPPGAVGELVIASSSTALGYLHDEKKTAACFLKRLGWADTLVADVASLYRTGDLLRYNTDLFDGSFEFVGRKDHQIKLRGFRIEPGEIEYHLRTMAMITNAHVSVPKNGPLKGELVAVVQIHGKNAISGSSQAICLDHAARLDIEKVREHLTRFVPSYMVPTRCFTVECIPVVPSMKIDRSKVKAWLEDTTSDANVSLRLTENPQSNCCLEPHELVAIDLSGKLAEFVGGSESHRQVLRHTNLYLRETGLDSIQTMSLSIHIQKVYGVKVPLATLLNSNTSVRRLAELVTLNPKAADASPAERIDVIAEAKAVSESFINDATVGFTSSGLISPPVKNVLLTGGTGFLGRTVLQRLLQREDIRVVALVRCHGTKSGYERLVNVAKPAGWWYEDYRSRIDVWPGDIEQPNLGLTEKLLGHLFGRSSENGQHIHAILHCGALVDYTHDYSSLVKANVNATWELLRAAWTSPSISAMLYVSGGSNPNESTDFDDPGLGKRLRGAGGYAQTKFVAESLVRNATPHKPSSLQHLRILRPGHIIGSLENGVAAQTDFIWRLIATCLEIEAYSTATLNNWLFVEDVESVAELSVSAIFQNSFGNADCEAVLRGLYFCEIWDLLQNEFGYRLQGLDHASWIERMMSTVWARAEFHPLFPFLDGLEQHIDAMGASGWSHDEENKQTIPLMQSNIRFLIQRGVFPAPQSLDTP